MPNGGSGTECTGFCEPCRIMFSWQHAPAVRDALCPKCRQRLSRKHKARGLRYTTENCTPHVREASAS